LTSGLAAREGRRSRCTGDIGRLSAGIPDLRGPAHRVAGGDRQLQV